MKKIMLITILMLTMLISVFAYDDWKYPDGLGGQRENPADGDVIFTTYNESSVSLVNFTAEDEPIVADFVSGNTQLEAVFYDGCNLLVSDMNFTTLGRNEEICQFSGRNFTGLSAFDWDEDGDTEIIASATDNTNGYFQIYDVSAGGVITSLFNETTTYPTYNREPKCYDGYCYLNDYRNNMYRLTIGTGAKNQINYGSLATDTRPAPITIDDCIDEYADKELLTYGDLDLDGTMDDIVFIDLVTFSVIATGYNRVLYDIHQPITCGNITSSPTKGIALVDGTDAWCTCYESLGGTPPRYDRYYGRDSVSIWEYNTGTGFFDQLAVIPYQTTPRYSELLSFDCPAGSGGSCRQESNTQLRGGKWFSQVIWDAGWNPSDETLIAVLRKQVNTAYDTIEIRNISSGTLDVVDSLSIANHQVFGSTGNQYDVELTKTDVDGSDLFNFKYRSLITPIGAVLKFNPSLIEYQKLLDFPFANNTLGWIVVDDESSYADYVGIDYNFNGTFYTYSDDFGAIVPETPSVDNLPTATIDSITPPEQNINLNVIIETTISDDSPSVEVLASFDCDNDGVLEYSLDYRGLTPQFVCNYALAGLYTMNLTVSDDANAPDNNSYTDSVNIIGDVVIIENDWTEVGNFIEHDYGSASEGGVDNTTYTLYNTTAGNWYQDFAWGEFDYNVSLNQEPKVGDVLDVNTGYEFVVANNTKILVYNETLGLITSHTLNDTSNVLEGDYTLYDLDEDGYNEIIFVESIYNLISGRDIYYLTVLDDTGSGSLEIEFQSSLETGNSLTTRNKVPQCDEDDLGDRYCYVMTDYGELISVDSTGSKGINGVLFINLVPDFRYNVISPMDFNGDGTTDLAGWKYDDAGNPFIWVRDGSSSVITDSINLSSELSFGDGCRFTSPLQYSDLYLTGKSVVFSLNCHSGNGASQSKTALIGVMDSSSNYYEVMNITGTYDGTATSDPINLHVSQPLINEYEGGGGDEICAFFHAECNGDANTNDCSGSMSDGVDQNLFACEIEQGGWGDIPLYVEVFSSTYDMGFAVTRADFDGEDNNPSVADGTEDFVGGQRFIPVGTNYESIQESGFSFEIRDQTDMTIIDSVSGRAGKKVPFQQSTLADILFVDDFRLFLYTDELVGYEGGTNIMAYLTDIFPVPNPPIVNVSTMWNTVILNPDDSSTETKTAFDCDNDGVLEYAWANRGGSPSFECIYNATGTFDATAWVSDNANYPDNSSLSEEFTVVDTGEGCDGTCLGFIAPSCTGTCALYDDFSYAPYCYTCNGWVDLQRSPVSGSGYLFDLTILDDFYLSLDDAIDYNDYHTFSFEFDFKHLNNDAVSFIISDKDNFNQISYLTFENGIIYQSDDISPFTESLGTYDSSRFYNLRGVVDFRDGSVTYYFDGGSGQNKYVTDIGTTSAKKFEFDYYSGVNINFYIDNFKVTYGEVNTNGTAIEGDEIGFSDGQSYLTTGNLCAINWTSHTFIEEECAVRGYSTKPEFEQLCLIRSCLNDFSMWVYSGAISNIFKTIIIVIVVLLFAPLMLMLYGKMKR